LDELSAEQFMCCPDHIASFAVTMPVDIAFDRKYITISFLVIFNLLLVVFLFLGFYLDIT
jgi:hypothetical protein